MKIIRDPIHGNLAISRDELQVLDAPEMQRLRRVRQLGFVYFVYPSATHSRFEHSLGAFHVAGRIAKAVGLENDEAEQVKLAALLHDIGHGPYSHSSEIASNFFKKTTHEMYTSKLIKKSAVSDALKDAGHNPDEIAKIATGRKKPNSDIVSGDIDADRMDYLMRDSYYTGAAYGIVDLDHLLLKLMMTKQGLVVDEEGLSAVESMLIARYLMYPAVYSHKTSRIADAMFTNALIECLQEKAFTIDELFRMDDAEVFQKIRSHGGGGESLLDSIERRDLHKAALRLSKEDFGKSFEEIMSLKSDIKNLKKLEAEITEECGLERNELLLEVPQPQYTKEVKTLISDSGKLKKLEEFSPLVKALQEAQWKYWNVGVYASAGKLKTVSKKAKDILLGI
ncbi:TPA: HD domain-containing protein [archaeon]|nr:HD domain-containing protein [Candidatus Undinarchaeales archaeon SRR5007147.bin71]